MSERISCSPGSISRDAMVRVAAAVVPRKQMIQGPSIAMRAMHVFAAGGVHHLVDATTGEKLGMSIDPGVLERTRNFFK